MARVTVEDCLEHVENNFELILKASERARDIANGMQPLVDEEGDKPTVIALREIADGLLDGDFEPQPMIEEEATEFPSATF